MQESSYIQKWTLHYDLDLVEHIGLMQPKLRNLLLCAKSLFGFPMPDCMVWLGNSYGSESILLDASLSIFILYLIILEEIVMFILKEKGLFGWSPEPDNCYQAAIWTSGYEIRRPEDTAWSKQQSKFKAKTKQALISFCK